MCRKKHLDCGHKRVVCLCNYCVDQYDIKWLRPATLRHPHVDFWVSGRMACWLVGFNVCTCKPSAIVLPAPEHQSWVFTSWIVLNMSNFFRSPPQIAAKYIQKWSIFWQVELDSGHWILRKARMWHMLAHVGTFNSPTPNCRSGTIRTRGSGISRGSCPHRHPHLSTAIHSPKVPLVGGFKHFFIFHNIWDNPSHWHPLTNIFQDGYCTTNQTTLSGFCGRTCNGRVFLAAGWTWACDLLENGKICQHLPCWHFKFHA